MDWLITKNCKAVKLEDIPCFSMEDLRKTTIEHCRNGKRVVLFFGNRQENDICLYAVLADDATSRLFVAKSIFKSGESYQCLTNEIPSFCVFEREFFEEFGITPLGHPWLKPVRFPFCRADKLQTIENYPFFKMKGEEMHEVAVGPVHAGIIEPGHFRFMCNGENVHHLEIQLGYQHRGIEKLFLDNLPNNPSFKLHLAESIAGDSVIAHAYGYSQVLESLSAVEITQKSATIRAIALEIERIAMHTGDLAAICNDVAYLLGNAVFSAARTNIINSLLSICGNRFGRGLIRIGGVVCDIDSALQKKIKAILCKAKKDITLMADIMFSSVSVLSRLEQTGIVNKEDALKIGMVGPAARASGIDLDIRSDHPYGIYRNYPIQKTVLDSGDVFSRSYLRFLEINESIKFIMEQLENLSGQESLLRQVDRLNSDGFVVSMVEGWRGEVIHAGLTNERGELKGYKIKDPSFNNWLGLGLAVRNNGISDFPLCNKSFNLSYCGHDL